MQTFATASGLNGKVFSVKFLLNASVISRTTQQTIECPHRSHDKEMLSCQFCGIFSVIPIVDLMGACCIMLSPVWVEIRRCCGFC